MWEEKTTNNVATERAVCVSKANQCWTNAVCLSDCLWHSWVARQLSLWSLLATQYKLHTKPKSHYRVAPLSTNYPIPLSSNWGARSPEKKLRELEGLLRDGEGKNVQHLPFPRTEQKHPRCWVSVGVNRMLAIIFYYKTKIWPLIGIIVDTRSQLCFKTKNEDRQSVDTVSLKAQLFRA